MAEAVDLVRPEALPPGSATFFPALQRSHRSERQGIRRGRHFTVPIVPVRSHAGLRIVPRPFLSVPGDHGNGGNGRNAEFRICSDEDLPAGGPEGLLVGEVYQDADLSEGWDHATKGAAE